MNAITMVVRLTGFEVFVGDKSIGVFYAGKTDVNCVYDAFINLTRELDIEINCIDKTDDFPF